MKVTLTLMVFLALLAAGCSQKVVQNEDAQLRRACSKNTQTAVPGPCVPQQDISEHDCYHVVIFALQNYGRTVNPAQTHVFATWVRSRNKDVIDQVDISWVPATTGIGETEGKNKSLAATLEDGKGRQLTYWVMRTDKTFFDQALKQREQLVLYRAVDGGSRPRAVNCIHAVSDVAGHLDTGGSVGVAAAQKIALFYVKTGKAWQVPDDKWVIQSVMKTNNCTLP